MSNGLTWSITKWCKICNRPYVGTKCPRKECVSNKEN